MFLLLFLLFFFFFNDTATTEIYTLSLHDALPIRRSQGEVTTPRVRAGVPYIPPGHARGRVRVLVTLSEPPLAAWSGRALQGRSSLKLDLRASSSRRYRARLGVLQRQAIARLQRVIPTARVGHRYSLL